MRTSRSSSAGSPPAAAGAAHGRPAGGGAGGAGRRAGPTDPAAPRRARTEPRLTLTGGLLRGVARSSVRRPRVDSSAADFLAVEGRVAEVRGRIAEAVARGGHGQAVTLIAVTKTHGPEAVEAAWAAGVTDVGENKVQEATAKQDALALAPCTTGGVRWHLIGHLQTNKAKALPRFALFHALDRDGLVEAADAVGRKAAAVVGAGAVFTVVPQPVSVLVQVNVSGEDTKGGYPPAEVPAPRREAPRAPGALGSGRHDDGAFRRGRGDAAARLRGRARGRRGAP